MTIQLAVHHAGEKDIVGTRQWITQLGTTCTEWANSEIKTFAQKPPLHR